jgi:hypothetical protein
VNRRNGCTQFLGDAGSSPLWRRTGAIPGSSLVREQDGVCSSSATAPPPTSTTIPLGVIGLHKRGDGKPHEPRC